MGPQMCHFFIYRILKVHKNFYFYKRFFTQFAVMQMEEICYNKSVNSLEYSSPLYLQIKVTEKGQEISF